MSKADKMFEELGYVKSSWNNFERFTLGTGDVNLEITFYDGVIYANHFLYGNVSGGSMALTKDNLKAINEKMKELGWLEDEPSELREYPQERSETNDKLKLSNNQGAALHIDTDREIYFSIKDVNQRETMVSISEVYRALRNIETLLGGNVKFEESIEEVGLIEKDKKE